MAREKRMTTKAKVVTAIIYVLAVALLVGVFLMNRHIKESKVDSYVTNVVATQSVETTEALDLPYNAAASDKYADLEPIYTVSQVSIQQDASGDWVAYVNGAEAMDYTGVAKNDRGWWFVRDGVVDFHYNGIAGNESGNWYINSGKVDFTYTGTFTVNGNSYKIVEGQVIE